jgi:hypothetical protein
MFVVSVVCCQRSLRRADHSSRGVLLTVVCHWVWSRKPLEWGGRRKPTVGCDVSKIIIIIIKWCFEIGDIAARFTTLKTGFDSCQDRLPLGCPHPPNICYISWLYRGSPPPPGSRVTGSSSQTFSVCCWG